MEFINASGPSEAHLCSRASWASSAKPGDDCFEGLETLDIESSQHSRGILVYFEVRHLLVTLPPTCSRKVGLLPRDQSASL
jgi:hypothetical protein